MTKTQRPVKIALAAALAAAMAAANAANAQSPSTGRIAAVVNNEAITAFDLESRVRLALLSTRIPNSADSRRRLSAQVLRTLINETLQMQEAKRLRVTVSDREVATALAQIEKRNRMGKGTLLRTLRSRNVNPQTLVDQIRANMAWGKVIQRAVRSRVRVGEAEVDDAIRRLSANRNRLQYRMSEIFLPVDAPGQEAIALRTARRLLTQIRGGVNFAALARQFSQSSTSTDGGDMGVVFEGQLEPQLEEAIKRVRPGQVIGPIKTASGYYILLLRDKRKLGGNQATAAGVSVAMASFTVPRNASKTVRDEILRTATELQTSTNECGRFLQEARKVKATVVRRLPVQPASKFPKDVRTAISGLKAGQATAPLTGQDGISLYMVCKRGGIGSLSRDAIWRSLVRQKLSVYSRQYMRDLRRAAFIDIRV